MIFLIVSYFRKVQSWVLGLQVLLLLFVAFMFADVELSVPVDVQRGQYTVRVNTFRRNDLLEKFLEHYTTCPEVREVTVVWSDLKNAPPAHLAPSRYAPGKVRYEMHKADSISNRFKALDPVPTEAVLSVDDDLLMSCNALRRAHLVWESNKNVLVGFAPRMHALDPETGDSRYLHWQHTWWSGKYSIMLTKVCFMHRKYLEAYFELIPQSLIDSIDAHRNCEDLAMAHVVAFKSHSPPVWVSGVVHEMSQDGISSRPGHFEDRSACLSTIRDATRSWPWVTSHQKVLPLTLSDAFSFWNDNKL